MKSLEDVMRINGDTEKLGDWNRGLGPLNMTIGPQIIWLTGEIVRPWIINVTFS
jgi:hypothetical protein